MNREQIILEVDNEGNFIKYIPKEVGHLGEGKRHLAITVLLINSTGQVLLQKRKHQIFDNVWDLTGATHPLHLPDGTDETLEEATKRCLKYEWGITGSKGIKKAGVFNYFARYGEYCENEHCYLMVGEYDGEVNLNPQAGYEYKWMDKQEFIKELQKNPGIYTPWANEGIKLLADRMP